MNEASNTQLFAGSSGSSVNDDDIYKPYLSPHTALSGIYVLEGAFLFNDNADLFHVVRYHFATTLISKCSHVSQADHFAMALQILWRYFLLLQ